MNFGVFQADQPLGKAGEKPGHNTSFVLVNVEQRETVLQN